MSYQQVTYSKLPGEVFEVIGHSEGADTPKGLVCLRFIDCPRVAVWANPKELTIVHEQREFAGLDLVI